MPDNCASAKFLEEVRSKFDFLANFGFSIVSSSPHRVRFESKKVFLEVSHDEHDGEVAISFGRVGSDEQFSFTLFLRLVNAQLEGALGERLATSPAEICDNLKRLANALRSEGQMILVGDDKIFERMKPVRWWHFKPEALKPPTES